MKFTRDPETRKLLRPFLLYAVLPAVGGAGLFGYVARLTAQDLGMTLLLMAIGAIMPSALVTAILVLLSTVRGGHDGEH